MEETSRRVLETFDRLGLTRLRAADFPSPEHSAAAQALLAELLTSGHLRQVQGFYERTEIGRLEVAAPLEMTLLTRPGCHLCQEALRQIEPLVTRFGALLRVINVDSDHTLRDRYGDDVPVVFLGNREVARHRIDPGRVRLELSRAR